MKWIKSFEAKKAKDKKEPKDKIDLGEKGALRAKSNIKKYFKSSDCDIEIYKDEVIFYRLSENDYSIPWSDEDDHEIYYDIENFSGWGECTLSISELRSIFNKFEKIDTSKPFKLEFEDGVRYFNTNLMPHREDGPAVELNNYSEWWVNGELHREDGPAIESNEDIYYLNGKELKKSDYYTLIKSKRGERDDLSKDELKDLLIDLIDEYDSYKMKYSKDKSKWTIAFSGSTTSKSYECLASLNERIKDKGQSIIGISQNETSLVINIQ
jgi:hypothetical protein